MPVATKGIDCSAPLTAQTAAALAAAGYRFACRYLVPERYDWKRLTRAEAEAITAAGLHIVSVFETSAVRAVGGAAAGSVDGAEALQEARLIGQPAGSAIYFAVDFDAHPVHFDAIEAYLRAAVAVIGPAGYEIGVYGSCAVVDEMARRGVCQHFWQTYAWSRGQRSAKANIWQYKNGQTVASHPVDLNESYGGEGWWNTKPVEVEPKMKAEDAEKVVKVLQEAWRLDIRNADGTKLDRDEIHRLANEVRKAGGLPTT
jgi:hypothetical protein